MKIFIDAGHNDNGFDTGATGFGLREQDITFEIAAELKALLDKTNAEIKLSRPNKTDILGSDENSSLVKRCELANNFNADLFISIHCNAHKDETANGTECYVYSTKSKSYTLAQKIQKNLANGLELLGRGVKTSHFKVLECTDMPAILIETAFITNRADNEKLKMLKKDFAECIYSAIKEEYGLTETEETEEITNPLMLVNKLSEVIVINDVLGATTALSKAQKEDSPLYWMIRKIVNKENNI